MNIKHYFILLLFSYFNASAYDFPKDYYFAHKYIDGERLKDIAATYQVPFEKMLEINKNAATSGLKQGDIVRIPIVNLESIVAVYNGEEYSLLWIEDFANMNGIDSNSIMINELVHISIESLNNGLTNIVNKRYMDQVTIFFTNDLKVEIYDPEQIKMLFTSLQRIHFLRNNSHMVFNRG
jgi:hypothetical protein